MKRRIIFSTAILVLTLVALWPFKETRVSARVETEKTAPSVVRITPPAPVFDDAKRLVELAMRRKQVADSIGPASMLVLYSGEPRVYTNDVDYQFRQENNLYYLTGLKQKGATLVLLPGNPQMPELLFLPRRNPAAETWTGHMYSPQEAAQASGIKEIWEAGEFAPFIAGLRNHEAYQPKPNNILMSARAASERATAGDGAGDSSRGANGGFDTLFNAAAKNEAQLYMLQVRPEGESREYRREQLFAADWAKNAGGFTIKSVFPLFAQMRVKKSPMELEILQHAIDISIEAHERAWAISASAKWEYEVDSEVARVFKLRNADNWGYPDIVGCGANATTLHYEESQAPCKSGDLLLMDVGAEYDHYSADVTRTTPINGKFSPAQADIYQIVYDAQETVAKVAKPGATLSDINKAATEVVKDGLLKLGLITDRNSNQYRIWFMHGTGHWLGMNVHDVGGSAKFEPGMTFTNEPGIYIRPDALDYQPADWAPVDWENFKTAIAPAFQKYRGIGVRIEDDMVITREGVRWMTEALPRKMSDIESFIARARQEQR